MLGMAGTANYGVRVRRTVKGGAVALAVGALVLLPVRPAVAEAPSRVGWWSVASTTTPAAASVPIGPDVPAGGMLVQSAADSASPVAYAAVTYDLLPDVTVSSLVLQVATGSATTSGSALQLCALTEPDFVPAAGGSPDAAPGYDCAHALSATPGADGTSYTFAADTLRRGTVLAVAIVPAAAGSRVVLAPPTAASAVVSARPATTSTPPYYPAAPSDAAVPEAPAISGAVALPGLAPAQPAPVTLAPAGPTTATPDVATQQPSPVAQALVSKTTSAGHSPKGLVALALLLGVVVCWVAAGASAGRAAPGPATARAAPGPATEPVPDWTTEQVVGRT